MMESTDQDEPAGGNSMEATSTNCEWLLSMGTSFDKMMEFMFKFSTRSLRVLLASAL
jgi:hypothetical protein